MTTFYFVRHGQMDTTMAGKKFYKDFSYNMMTLSEKGIGQIKETAKDVRLANAELIIASPFGRTLHSAAILSKELNIDMKVETDLHEWLADAVSYDFLPDDIAKKSYKALSENEGRHPIWLLEYSSQRLLLVSDILMRNHFVHPLIDRSDADVRRQEHFRQ